MPQCQFLFFCCFSVSEKYLRKYSRNRTGQKPRTLEVRGLHGVKRRDGKEAWRGHTIGWRGPPTSRTTTWCGAPAAPLTPPFRLYNPPDEKTLSTRKKIPEKHPSPPPSSTLVREGSEAPPAPCRRGESSPEGSTPPCLPPDR